MAVRPFRPLPSTFCIKALVFGTLLSAVNLAEAQDRPAQPLRGVFREANNALSHQLPKLPPQIPVPPRVAAPLGNPQWQLNVPAIPGSQGVAGIIRRSALGAHNVLQPPIRNPIAQSPDLGSIRGIIPSFASTTGFGGVGGFPVGAGIGGLAGAGLGGAGLGGAGLGGGGLTGGVLGGALLGNGIQGLFAGLNPNSIVQIALGAGMLLSQMKQQKEQAQTAQNPPTPTPLPPVLP
ncbi:MAG: hypothetical protein RIS36_75 [Pseudomonadota bacterium]|jgi:hypothetical protein